MRNLRTIVSKEQANKYMEELDNQIIEKSEQRKKKFRTSGWKKIVDIYSVLSKQRRWIPKEHFSEQDVLAHWEALRNPSEFRVVSGVSRSNVFFFP